MNRIVLRLSYANVMSTLALFVALSGGALAASRFVSARGVVKLCITANGSVKAASVKRGCARDSAAVSVNQRGSPGHTGAVGVPGPAGPIGVPGAPGGGAVAYAAGSGLTLSGVTFSANPALLQTRIAGSGCAADQALRSVTQAGEPTCTSLHAYSATAGVSLAHADGAVPPGKWVLYGQMTAGGANTAMTVYCQIDVNGVAVTHASQYVPSTQNGALALVATATTTATPAAPIAVSCGTDGTGYPQWSNGTIVAIPVAALN